MSECEYLTPLNGEGGSEYILHVYSDEDHLAAIDQMALKICSEDNRCHEYGLTDEAVNYFDSLMVDQGYSYIHHGLVDFDMPATLIYVPSAISWRKLAQAFETAGAGLAEDRSGEIGIFVDDELARLIIQRLN